MSGPMLRVLVADDSRAFRGMLASCIGSSGCAAVVAHAGDGREAVARAGEHLPDVATLDLEMPNMDGIAALRELRARHPRLQVIMVSAHTRTGALSTMRALEAGARDFITKPDGGSAQENVENLKQQIHAQLHAIARDVACGARATVTPLRRPPPPSPSALGQPVLPPQIVGIGSSTGGPVALGQLVPALPANLAVPVVVVQHMPALFTASLAETLAERSKVRVVEARHGMPLEAGTVYIAPGGCQLRVGGEGRQRHVELNDDPPENFCRPSVDYTFRSIAEAYRDRAMGVILTGMGRDGAAGLRVMKQHGVRVVGQNASTCVVYGMPKEAMLAGVVDVELPIERIADEIVAVVSGRRR